MSLKKEHEHSPDEKKIINKNKMLYFDLIRQAIENDPFNSPKKTFDDSII